MRSWRPFLDAMAIAVAASATGCSSLIGNHIPIEMQVVEPRSNFIDEALGHRYSDWYSIVGANTPCFGARIPVSRIAERANRLVSNVGPDQARAYLRAHGCEPTSERSCAYSKILRRIEERRETERRLVILHFTLSPNAAKGCSACADVRLEIGRRVGGDGQCIANMARS